jgi:hypothetical protein
MTNLESLEREWIDLFDDLRLEPETSAKIAAPFLSIRATEERSILYVGKATAKDWYRDDYAFGPPHPSDKETTNARIKERHGCARKFVQKVAPTYNSGFWQFARELSAEAAKKWNVPLGSPLQHITWTNICKIGALKGNPSGVLFSRQRDLAIETLRQEVKVYEPQLICFVTWDYAWDLVKKVFGDHTDESWDQTRNEEWMWFRAATDGIPTALLIGHPERKPEELRKRWLNKALELLPGA